MKREVVLFFSILISVILSNLASASLGIGPAIKEYNFAPGQRIQVNYYVTSDDPNKEIELYVEGDFAEYVTLSRENLLGGGNFDLILDLPNEWDNPGKNTLIIGARELPPEDQFIGTAVNIRAIMRIYVPYPGRYIESTLNVPDANIDEQIPVELHVINRGKESLDIDANIKFYDGNNELVDDMSFEQVFLEPSQDRYFRKFLDATGYRPGNYLAEAIVLYGGDMVRINETFRIGSLFVNITNFTDELPKKGIQKFYVGIESRWNGALDEVFADVNLSNGIQNITFRTPSINLGAWESKNLEGYINTDELEGIYEADITLKYAGQTTSARGNLEIKEFSYMVFAITGIIFIFGIIGIIYYIRKKRNEK